MLRSEDLENLKTSLLSRHRLPVFNKLTGSRVSNLIPDFLEEISKIKNTAYNNNENFSFVLNEKNENNLPETFLIPNPKNIVFIADKILTLLRHLSVTLIGSVPL
jgi:hypothetical protein